MLKYTRKDILLIQGVFNLSICYVKIIYEFFQIKTLFFNLSICYVKISVGPSGTGIVIFNLSICYVKMYIFC